MAEKIGVKQFLQLSYSYPMIDVRSPGEYNQAHIPEALSLPLFSNEERAKVGTIYKKIGKRESVVKGLEIVGPKLSSFIKFALSLKSETLLLYCWRGGMRSASMAWLFETVGIKCYLLEGGYKSYRTAVLEGFKEELKIILLGGYTGAGKTDLLKHLRNSGEQVLDLEGMAHHKGSAFGAIGESAQPTTEHFENILSQEISLFDKSKPVWVEDESHSVGKVYLPESFWRQMRKAPIIKITTSFEARLNRLMRDYGSSPIEELKTSIKRIEKRLGYDKCKEALTAIEHNQLREAAQIALLYYDKAYQLQLTKRFGEEPDNLPTIKYSEEDKEEVLQELVTTSRKLLNLI